MIALWIIFSISVFVVFFAMIGYPVLLIVIDSIKNTRPNDSDSTLEPSVTYMIVAHNEEKVIKAKLLNALEIDYPCNKIEILVASDNSDDQTNSIVNEFIESHVDRRIQLYVTKEHKGKTNAQNEAQKLVSSDILVMTDANTMVDKNAIKELVSYFTDDDITYVCGKLVYSNSDNLTCDSESTYWNIDLTMRYIESKIQTITAGNGALYACRNKDYISIDPIRCHDSAMPYEYALQGKRALFNPNAIAVEKSGDNNDDEFKRKVRMNRRILSTLASSIRTCNPIKYRWFSLFYFGHRTCRYSLWIAHIAAFLSTLVLSFIGNMLGMCLCTLQIIAYIVSYIAYKMNVRNKVLRMISYYGMTVLAQFVGVCNILSGKVKPVWEKAESTR